jgi:hypothetical protein
MEPKFSPEKPNGDKWGRAILLEREKQRTHPLMIEALREVVNKDSALILGDACKVNSKYLIEESGFQSVDNVDSSPLINDDYYVSEKLHNYEVLFGSFEFPENKYDFIYGKSITFLKKELLEKMLLKIEKSLKTGGVFVSTWLLSKNTTVPFGKWEEGEIEKVLVNINLTTLLKKEILQEGKNLSGNDGISHYLELVMKK